MMIEKIEIQNYKSIIKTNIELTPLTVIIGANASGKSNLIKCFEFFTDIVQKGMNPATEIRGGVSSIFPKYKNISKNAKTSIKIRTILPNPEKWVQFKLPELTMEYELVLKREKNNRIVIDYEKLTVNEILLFSQFWIIDRVSSSVKGKFNPKNYLSNHTSLLGSRIDIKRNKENRFTVDFNFSLDEDNYKSFYYWLGLNKTLGNYDTSSPPLKKIDLKELSELMFNSLYEEMNTNIVPFFSSNRPASFFSEHISGIHSYLSDIIKYEFFIKELRSEQLISGGSIVTSIGSNLPSITRQLKTNKSKRKNWQRIINTMANISPSFKDVKHKYLVAGKEYLLFSENFNKKDIESWESSDGTLRAFAILVALESLTMGSIVMIEEPEHGLHPWALKELLSHIREVMKERRLQIIMTTHSPQVLENINQEELIIAERSEKEGTVFKKVSDIIGERKIPMSKIGEMWVRGLLSGVPLYK